MNVLPVVHRELRVAARQPRTYNVRMLAALAGMVVTGYVVLIQRRTGFTGGSALFLALTQLAGWVCLLGGVRLTADAISQEKRDGTLGFLFLSHLSGLDVVLGKLAAQATRGGYALLATMPVMAIAFLDGGVQPGEFWFTMLALTNLLFFSVCVGLWVSALSTDPRRALGSATGVALFFWLALPLLGQLSSTAPAGSLAARLAPVWACLSPASTVGLSAAFGVATATPWLPLGCTHAVAWGFLGWAAVATRRAWQERPASRLRARGGNWWRDVVMGGPEKRAARRRRALEPTAFLWLLVRSRWKPWFPTLVFGGLLPSAALLWAGATSARAGTSDIFTALLMPMGLLLHVALKFWIAGEAAHAMTTQRREGALELLFTTPLTFRDVIQAQFRALRRQFGVPVLAVSLATLAGGWAYANLGLDDTGGRAIAVAVAVTAALFADAYVLVWLGTWLGLSGKKLRNAPGNTAFRVLVLPWILLLVMLPAAIHSVGPWPDPLILWAVVGFGSDFFWWQYARSRLGSQFRAEVARAAGYVPG